MSGDDSAYRRMRDELRRENKADSIRGKYAAYRRTPHWLRTAEAAKKRVGYKCQRCGSGRLLQVHHRSYDRLYGELPEDLEVVCDECHTAEHVRREQRENARIEAEVGVPFSSGRPARIWEYRPTPSPEEWRKAQREARMKERRERLGLPGLRKARPKDGTAE